MEWPRPCASHDQGARGGGQWRGRSEPRCSDAANLDEEILSRAIDQIRVTYQVQLQPIRQPSVNAGEPRIVCYAAYRTLHVCAAMCAR